MTNRCGVFTVRKDSDAYSMTAIYRATAPALAGLILGEYMLHMDES